MFEMPADDDAHPIRYWTRCLEFPEHVHLKEGEPSVGFLLRTFPKVEGGRTVLGSIHLPSVTGKLKEAFLWMVGNTFGYMPDFLVILDEAYWRAGDDRLREILMFHEMSHAVHKQDQYGAPRFDQEGRPVWGLVGHDVEEFTSVAARYGAWNPELERFVAAASAGGSA
jgi:hypothetical protein